MSIIKQLELLDEPKIEAKPFLKWAGGKRQLLAQITQFLPKDLKEGRIKRYIEPFIGSGAVFIHLAQHYPLEEFYLFDINPELIIAYQTIQKNVSALVENLSQLQEKYLNFDEKERKLYYYNIRSQFNEQKIVFDFSHYNKAWIERTAQLIFLNRTCFNGLFRVNSQGKFNVPMGKYKNPCICQAENLFSLAQVLQKAHIFQGDFAKCEQWVNSETFVYFDPPYKPITNTSSFTSYSAQNFDDSEQIRLRDFFAKLDHQGAKLMLSNSDPQNEDAMNDFFEQAYQGYNIQRVKATRSINSKGNKRGEINELLMMNYKL